MRALAGVYAVFLILSFLFRYGGNASYKPKITPPWSQWVYYELKDRHGHLGLAAFHTASVTGYKIKFPARIKKILRTLHIEHLATPSGLHLSMLTSLFFPFLRRWQRIVFLLPFFYLNNFYSLKRVALLKVLRLRFPKANTMNVFIFVMIIDFFLGSGFLSPYSFLYGLLFLGSITATLQTSPISSHLIPLSLLGAQCLVSYTSSSPLFLGGFFFGLVITLAFSFIFPFLLIDVILLKIPYWPLWSVSDWLLKCWWKLVLFGEKVSTQIGPTEISLIGLIAVFLILFKKVRLAAICIFFNCATVWNAPTVNGWSTTMTRPSTPVKVVKKKWGYETYHEKKRRCRHRHRPIGYEIKCN